MSLSTEALPALRLRAYALVQSGLSQGAVARMLSVSRKSVNLWCRRVALAGFEALTPKKRGNPTGPRLQGEQAAHLQRLIQTHRPRDLDLPFPAWSYAAAQALIAQVTGLHLSSRSAGNYLRRWGLRPG